MLDDDDFRVVGGEDVVGLVPMLEEEDDADMIDLLVIY